MGVMADATSLDPEMKIGTMEGPGVTYHFQSGKTEDRGMLNVRALYLGADSVPFMSRRGVMWDISGAARHLWGAVGLGRVGKHIGLHKMAPDFDCPSYAFMDSVVTLIAANRLTEDFEKMGFTKEPDRFISGATVAKDVMSRHYADHRFFLEQKEHDAIWPAYMGGMTGSTNPDTMREPQTDVVYGDLDGAYNVCGQRLDVFGWSGVRKVTSSEIRSILVKIQSHPEQYWKYGSLHLQVTGDFDFCPVRVAEVGDFSEKDPSTSSGLVWAEMRNYSTTLALGDFLHSKPNLKTLKIHGGYMARPAKGGRSPCLFKMAADERKKHKKGTVENTWWKLVGNCLYGSFANRNGKDRMLPGKWFNVLIASSITAGIRHLMHIVNETAGADCFYNDTDSGAVSFSVLADCQKALEPLGVGFSNKTDDELPGHDVADFIIVQGSKRYCMVKDDDFGAKCHGLGSWFACGSDIDSKYRVASLAHNHDLLKAVWQVVYPEWLGEPPENLFDLPLFHRFSIKTRKVSTMVQNYAVRRYGIPSSEAWRYGKAGNFGFLAPTLVNGKVVPVVCYNEKEASELSDVTLGMVAYGWGRAQDKKFDYRTNRRWRWDGSEVREVVPVAHTQLLIAGQQDALEGDISVHVAH
jgi:hypothetical protein